MRKRIRNSEEEVKESINVSPLIDVVFILLIFFIVSATFVSLPGVEISRPRTETAESLERNSIVFALSGQDEIFHAGKKVKLREVPGLIEKASKDRAKRSSSKLINGLMRPLWPNWWQRLEKTTPPSRSPPANPNEKDAIELDR